MFKKLFIMLFLLLAGYVSRGDDFLRFDYLNLPQVLSQNTVNVIFKGHRGFMWIGTWQYGISVYFPQADSFIVYHYQKGNKNSLQDNAVTGLYFYSPFLLLIGYANGSIDVLNIRVFMDKNMLDAIL